MTMLTFGSLTWRAGAAAYREISRVSSYRLAPLERVGAAPAYHYIGRGEDVVTLRGVIMPTYRGSPALLDDLRALAAAGETAALVAGTGRVYGRWALTAVDETRTGLFSDGGARKVAYTLRFVRADNSPAGRQGALESAAAAHGDVAAVVAAVQGAAAAGGDAAAVIAAAEGAA